MTCRKCTRTSTFRRKSSPRPSVVLGIDPGTTGMGYAFVDIAIDPPEVLECGMVKPTGATAAERLRAIGERLDQLIALHRPAVLALERLYFNKNARTAMAVSEARGVALLCAGRARIDVAEYTPQEVKLSVTGSGNADKAQVKRMVGVIRGEALVASKSSPMDDNVADAVAIAFTHGQRARLAAVIAAAER